MKIRLARSCGFCFGVKRAIDVALKTAALNRKLCMLGDIVHNEDVVRQIEKAGIKKIRRLAAGNGKTLLISAHGAAPGILQKAEKLGYTIADATCPMVKEIHKIVRRAEACGNRIIVIGDRHHVEVRGIIGQLKRRALVIDDRRHIPRNTLKKIKKACVVVQSTQNLEKTLQIFGLLKNDIRDVEFFNTICKPTRLRQEEIRRMPLENDVMIIIGSKNSANTKRLYEISKSLNKRSYWVTSQKEIREEWLQKAGRVGITTGASTPAATTQAVIEHIKRLC